MKIKVTIAVISLVVIIWLLMPKQATVDESIDGFDSYVNQVMLQNAIPGMALARIKQGQLDYIKSYGYANIEQNIRVTEDTLFNIASISKPIMGVALLQLVEQGKLSLDTDINEYLPFKVNNPHFTNETITLRHLASHTSGIADFYDINTYSVNKDPKISLEQHLKQLLLPDGTLYNAEKVYLQYQPGKQRAYSNLGAGLAGFLVEGVIGVSLADYSQQYVFPRLGMNNTSWRLNDLELSDVAVPYAVRQCVPWFALCASTEQGTKNYIIETLFNPPAKNKTYEAFPHFGNPQYPDGGIRTSIKQLAHFLVYLLNNTDRHGLPILSDKLYSEMFSLQQSKNVSSRQRFFWRDNVNGLTGHKGSDLGVYTSLYFDRKTLDGYIILMNRSVDGDADRAMDMLARRIMQ